MSTNRHQPRLREAFEGLKSPSAASETTFWEHLQHSPLCLEFFWLFFFFFLHSFLLWVHSLLSASLQLTGNMKHKTAFHSLLCKAEPFHVLAWKPKAPTSCSDAPADKPAGPGLTFPNLFWISIKAAPALHRLRSEAT